MTGPSLPTGGRNALTLLLTGLLRAVLHLQRVLVLPSARCLSPQSIARLISIARWVWVYQSVYCCSLSCPGW